MLYMTSELRVSATQLCMGFEWQPFLLHSVLIFRSCPHPAHQLGNFSKLFVVWEGNAVNNEDSMYFERWDKPKHPWVQMCTSHFHILKLVIYNVNIYEHYVWCTATRWYGVIPWVVLNRMSLFVVLCRKLATDHASECTHDLILCAPKFVSASLNCLVKA